jgi:hypothetical protein
MKWKTMWGGESGISEKKLDFELSCRVYQAKIALVNIICQMREE